MNEIGRWNILPEIIKREINKKLVCIFVLSLIINLFAIYYVGNFHSPQTWENGEIAENLLNGKGYSGTYFGTPVQPTSIMVPFYPIILYIFYSVFGITSLTYILIQILQGLILSFTVVLLYIIAKKLFNEQIAILSALIMAIYPVYIYGVTVIHQLTFTTFFISILILGLLKLETNANININMKTYLICGVALGLIILTEPTILFFIPFMILWIFIQNKNKRDWKRSLKISSCILIIALLVTSPWIIRNYEVHDTVLIKYSGYAFWCGNSASFTETGIPGSYPIASYEPELIEKITNQSKQIDIDKIYMAEALKYVKENPMVFIRNFIYKAYNFWWFPNTPSIAYQTNIYRKIIYAPLLFFTVIGLVLSFKLKEWRRFLLLYFLFISFTIGYSIFLVAPRYRVPTIQPYMTIFACYAVYYMFTTYRERLKAQISRKR
jgi:4-amino-4-deoxy-L-arabinose transferase-like glycosyltransferase